MNILINFYRNINLEWSIIIILLSFLVFLYFSKINLKSKTQNIFLGIMFISLIVLAFKLEPPESFDLYRHYGDIIYFKTHSIIEIVSHANFLWYAIIKFFSLFEKFQFFSVSILLVSIFLFLRILHNLKKETFISNKHTLLIIFTFFSIVNLTHLMSGLRNVLAVSIFSIGILQLFSQKKTGYLLIIISLFIHPMVIILFFIYLFYKVIIKHKYLHILLLIWPIFSKIILVILSLFPLKYFELLYEKLNLELTSNFGTDIRVFIFEIIQILFITYLLYKLRKKITEENVSVCTIEKNIINYLYLLSLFIIGSVPLINIFIRCRFLIAYLMPVLIHLLNKYLGYNRKADRVLLILAYIINLYYIYYMMCNGVF